MSPLNFKHVAISAVVSTLLAASQSGFAHTGVQAGHIDELTTIDTNIAIGHGCEQANGTVKPIIAQSVVFPMAEYEAAVAAGTLDGFAVDTIQSKDIFAYQAEKFTAAGNLYAFSGRGGPGLNPSQLGRVPFQLSAPGIDELDGSNCISEVHVNLAVADICVTTSPKIRAGKLNLWSPVVAGSQIIAQAQANNVDGVGHGPHLVISNHNYDPVACNGVANILELSPTAAEIDDGLDINGYWMAP